jgi:ABC-type Mn2+/Zn2+ transport system ATPase subunit
MSDENSSPLLTITNLTVNRGERTVIKNLNLTLNKEERLMIRGDNGCGKTTLLKAVARLLPHQKGSIDFTGKTMGWVPQEGVVNRFPIAAREVVMIGTATRRLSRKSRLSLVKDMMAITDSTHLADRCFHHLSGGEKQRISLARCLCQQADLLLLDEPASYLDRESRENLDSLFQKIQSETGAALMLVTHEHSLFNSEKWIIRNMEGGQLC